MDRTAVLYGLLLSIPPGIGVVGYTAMMTGGGLVSPLGALAGAVTAVSIFTVVALGVAGEEPEAEAFME